MVVVGVGIGVKMNQRQYLLIRTLIHCAYSPRRLKIDTLTLKGLRSSLMDHWKCWRDAIYVMERAQVALEFILENEKGLNYHSKNLATRNIKRLEKIIAKAYKA